MKKNIWFFWVLLFFLSCDADFEDSSNNEIIIFTFAEQSEDPKIESIGASVSAKAQFGTNLKKITPTIVVSKDATVSPLSGVEVDFSKGPVAYVVTAENGEKKEWIVSIYADIDGLAEILYCEIANQSNCIIENDSVFIEMPYQTDVSALIPYFTVSKGASIYPKSGLVQDFSLEPIIYTVTSANGTEKKWPVTVVRLNATGRYILLFDVANQIGKTIIDQRNIDVVLPLGTDITAITADIEISDNATIVPGVGEPVDFSADSTATYVVTSEEGLNRTYTVRLTFQ